LGYLPTGYEKEACEAQIRLDGLDLLVGGLDEIPLRHKQLLEGASHLVQLRTSE
jgi:hypothetical protein